MGAVALSANILMFDSGFKKCDMSQFDFSLGRGCTGLQFPNFVIRSQISKLNCVL